LSVPPSAVDECFEDLLCDMFGSDVMESFRKKRPAGYIDLMIAFESRKRSCGPTKLGPLNIALPFSFIDFYRKAKGKDVSHPHKAKGDHRENHQGPNLLGEHFAPWLVWQL
jgi:hypothetical protein